MEASELTTQRVGWLEGRANRWDKTADTVIEHSGKIQNNTDDIAALREDFKGVIKALYTAAISVVLASIVFAFAVFQLIGTS